jgi:hypothetical protein
MVLLGYREGWVQAVGLGGVTLPPVAGVFAAVRGEFNARREKNCGAGPESVSILADGRLQFGENRPRFMRTCGGNGFSTEFSDAILKATSAHGHSKQVHF